MRILVTSDWQADYENLDLCKKAAKEILRLKDELGFTVLVHCGDFKHVYNPVDVRVTNFYIRTIGEWIDAGLDVEALLGNHDRVGQHVDKQNWLPVLKKAGAKTYDDPTIRNGLAFLPYRKSAVVAKREAKDLAEQAKKNSVLFFHRELRGARFNVLSASMAADFTANDLCPQKYLFCIGGHLHFQHKVAENVWYVGSPFATDWGEANQQKGYLLVDTVEQTIKRVRSRIPGWYDPSWPEFVKVAPKNWAGSRIRIKAKCDGVKHVGETLDKARREAATKYPNADIIVVPEFIDSGERSTGAIKISFPDEKKIRIYVQETLPNALKNNRKQVEAYLVDQLAQAGGLQRDGGELRIDSFFCKNFLSYRKIKFKVEPGLCVVAGENRDWRGRSNGSGKTSFLQPLAVSWFGKTFKDQKHDNWMRRGTPKDEEAVVKSIFRDAQNRACSVRRARHPNELKLVVDGEVVESGNRPESTQKLIEQVTGYTWETLANAIYIDQTRSHLMLTGKEAERKSFLAKLQNLERFERALKEVNNQKANLEYRLELLAERIQSDLRVENDLHSTIHDAEQILAINASIEAKYRSKKKEYLTKRDQLREWEVVAKAEVLELDSKLKDLASSMTTFSRKQAVLEEQVKTFRNRIERFEKLEGWCPNCEQLIDHQMIEIALPEIKRQMTKAETKCMDYEQRITNLLGEEEFLEDEKTKRQRNKKLEAEVSKLREDYEILASQMEQYQKQQKLIGKLKEKLRASKKQREEHEKKKAKILRWMKVVNYAQKVFHREGLPASLNEQLCPALNQAAEEYTELFSQGEIQVRFAVDEEGRTDVQVINAHGGENVNDQSEGEMKMASLITSFAVRSIAPKTNLLILDEPGDGLDQTSAKGFAKGLKQVVSRFGTILLTTHNPVILSELADARQVTVRKENRVSSVV